MKRTIYLMLMVVVAMLASCSLGDDENDVQHEPQTDAASVQSYDGTWSIDGKTCGSGTMLLDSANFVLTPMPCQAILNAVMPDSDVSDVGEADYVSAYDITGYSEQALYFGIRKPSVSVGATIDGTRRDVNLLVGWYGAFFVGASATYSRLSGVYKVTLPVSGYEVYEKNSDTLVATGDASVELTFVTKK